MRISLLFLLSIVGVAGAQSGRVYPDRKAFVVLGEALATGTGGVRTVSNR